MQYLRTLMQASDEETRQKKFGLTPRELEIVSAVVAGYSNKEIAEYFKISEDTVKHHLSNIFDKLGVSTRLELALFAVNKGLPLKSIPMMSTSVRTIRAIGQYGTKVPYAATSVPLVPLARKTSIMASYA